MNSLLNCQRDLFVIPDDICYMNCSYMSPMLKTVEQAGIQGIRLRHEPWNIKPPAFFEPAETVRKLFARIVNGDPEGVALIPSVSYGIGIAAANLPVAAGQNIVILKEQFPSNVYPWEILSKSAHADLRRVPYPEDENLTDALLQKIDSKTAVVSVPEIHWIRGAKIDLLKIREKTRSVGAALIVDLSQSLGAASFDFAIVQPDFLVTTGYKGMLGAYGLCYLHIAPQWREGVPLEQGWLNREKSDDFAHLTEYQSAYRKGARRFDYGERANPVLLGMAIPALEQLLDWGMDRVTAYNKSLVHYIMEKAEEKGFAHTAAAYCADNMMGVILPEGVSSELPAALQEESVYVNVRGNSIRLAPHVYNHREEVDRLFEVLPRYIR